MEVSLEFLEYQQRLNEFLIDTDQNDAKHQHDHLMLRHVFKFIHKNFNKLNQTIRMCEVLPILHHSLRLELQTGNSMNVGAYVYALLNLYDDNNSDEALQCCLQVLYQILQSLSSKDTQCLQIGIEVFNKVIEILLTNQSTSNNANILACLHLAVKKFKAVEIVTHLWNAIKDIFNSNQVIENVVFLQILIHFFDEFSLHIDALKKSTEFRKLVLRLLDSDQHDDRKCAYFLLKKAYLVMDEQMTRMTEADMRKSNSFWSTCISNFENLEENQSHLILPSLEQLRNINTCNPTQHDWLNILYRQILRHNNILVRRWILEYLFENVKYISLTGETQLQFMSALNDTTLYNVEVYMLPRVNIDKFLPSNQSTFLVPFSKINWKAVPLHFWLTQLIAHWKTVEIKDCTEEVLINLAIKIRAMQNVMLRRENIELVKKLFSKVIDDMKVTKYVQLIESLYNVSDPYDDVKILCAKLQKCEKQDIDGNCIFTLRFYNILTNQFFVDFSKLTELIKEKIEQNNWTPGALRFVMIFHSPSNLMKNFCRDHYGIHWSTIQLSTPLNELYEKFCRLESNDKERKLIKQKVTDIYAEEIKSFKELESSDVCLEELLYAGSLQILLTLTDLLRSHSTFIGTSTFKCFAEKLRDHLRNDKLCSLVCENLMEHCKLCEVEEDELVSCAKILLELNLENTFILESVVKHINAAYFSDKFLLKGALLANTKVGDARIEEAYECQILQRLSKAYLIRGRYAGLIASIPDINRKEKIFKNVCEMIRNINCKRTRYYANSKEHRSITHILSVILALLPGMNVESEWSSELWEFLLKHNNQLNITILYEVAITAISSWQEILSKAMEQLKANSCTSSQEVSMIAVLYRSYRLKCNFKTEIELENLVLLLWPLTMGAHFQTRLYAQLAICDLLDVYQSKVSRIPKTFSELGNILKRIISPAQFLKFREDIRFRDIKLTDAFEEVMSFTNASYDEFNFINFKSHSFRDENISTKQTQIKPPATDSVVGNFDVQRKLNPVADFMPLPDLYSYPEYKENVLYVVASLIDKIPNLGGIARTCEVLGIRNLVIDSKTHITKADFKNLSMTAETNLNIVEVKPAALTEFILQKKTEGFKIIGAEQTANSCSFVNFNFPKRSVLILGHEKEGISPNLLGFLDYAVEIPQFGMIRSLNVHVTGALFMWEYCKQHIIKT